MKLTSLCLSILLLSACEEEVCPNAQHLMEDFYDSLSNDSNFDDKVSYDSETHEYSFTINSDAQLCGIGYQSQSNVTDYLIQIIDDQNNIVLDEQLSFSYNKTEYVAVTPINLSANTEYTISRTCNNYSSISDVVGRILKFSSAITPPITSGDLTITKVAFYGNGNPPNNAVPFIDMAIE